MKILADNISKRYFRKTGSANYFEAVRPVSLDIAEGEVFVLMGRSGSGKTTLMNMLCGLLAPDAGRVLADETDLYSLTDWELSRLRGERFGVVPQARSAVDTLTVIENILLPAKLYGRDLAAGAVRPWMERLGIEKLADARPPELSGGELRRMAIVRALAQSPDCLFADEPTGDLDDENTALVLSALHAYAHEAGKTVFLVTHENDALRVADRVCRMDDGNLSPEGAGG